MAIKLLPRMGNPVLYERAQEVTDEHSHDYIQNIVNDMLDTMNAANGVGIAAPQIGINKRIIIFGFDKSTRYPHAEPVPITVLINPVLEILTDECTVGWEGCLSVPGLRGLVPRYTKIRYSGYDFVNKKNIIREVSGFHAIVVQHEMDHIDGVLFPHRVKDMKQFGYEGEELINPN